MIPLRVPWFICHAPHPKTYVLRLLQLTYCFGVCSEQVGSWEGDLEGICPISTALSLSDAWLHWVSSFFSARSLCCAIPTLWPADHGLKCEQKCEQKFESVGCVLSREKVTNALAIIFFHFNDQKTEAYLMCSQQSLRLETTYLTIIFQIIQEENKKHCRSKGT